MANTKLTKGQVRTAIRQAIDDPSSQRWSDTNLDVLTTIVQDTMFQSILDTFPWATSQTDTPTPAAGGIIDTTSLGALLSQRFYRVQQLSDVATGNVYQPKLFVENVPQTQTYFMSGENIVLSDASITQKKLAYGFLPIRYTDLATDNTALPAGYPEGHEAALIYLTAAWAMTKGDAESMAQIARIADLSIDALLMHVARRSPTGGLARVATVKAALVRNILTSAQAPAS